MAVSRFITAGRYPSCCISVSRDQITCTGRPTACERIAAGVKGALRHLFAFKPYVLTTPITLELTFKNYTPAEILSYLRSVQRVDSHTIRFVGKDMAEVDDFVEFVDNYNSDLTP